MNNATRRLLLALCLPLAACVAQPRQDFARHAMTVNGDGDIRAPVDGRFTDVSSEGFERYVDGIFQAAREKKASKILIFVHGGLNNLAASTKRVNELIGKHPHEISAYPIFINWDSGLFESYTDHLYSVRQGETTYGRGLPTAPFYLIADFGRTLVRAPITIGYTIDSDISALPGGRLTSDDKSYFSAQRENAEIVYQCVLEKGYTQVSRGRESDWNALSLKLYGKSLWNAVTYLPQLVTAPPIDGFGSPAWQSMQRRAKVLFHKPEQFDIRSNPARAADALDGRPPGAMTVFMQLLKRYLADAKGGVEVTLVAHSMGTFIVNEMVRAYPDLEYRNIVYMAGADSVRNTFNSVGPYMMAHKEARFYNLTLHPQAEVEEWTGLGFLPRGSLLVWVDNFFSTPHTLYDRTVGRWDNLVPALGSIHPDLRGRVQVKAFDQTSEVAAHGDFTKQDFWREDFWTPGATDCNRWPADKAGCPRPEPKPAKPASCKAQAVSGR